MRGGQAAGRQARHTGLMPRQPGARLKPLVRRPHKQIAPRAHNVGIVVGHRILCEETHAPQLRVRAAAQLRVPHKAFTAVRVGCVLERIPQLA